MFPLHMYAAKNPHLLYPSFTCVPLSGPRLHCRFAIWPAIASGPSPERSCTCLPYSIAIDRPNDLEVSQSDELVQLSVLGETGASCCRGRSLQGKCEIHNYHYGWRNRRLQFNTNLPNEPHATPVLEITKGLGRGATP